MKSRNLLSKHLTSLSVVCGLAFAAALAAQTAYFSENFDNVDTAGLVAKGWDLNKNEFALEIGTDFGVAVPPYAAENFPAGAVPGADFRHPVSNELFVTPPTADGTGSTGGFLISDSDAASGSDNIGSKSEFWATTPSFSTLGSTEAWFHADAEIEVNNNGECIVDLQASVDGGQTWILAWGQAEPQRPIKSFNYEPNEPGFEGSTPIGGYPVMGSASQTKTWSGIHGRWHVKLPAEVNNKPDVKLRIRYYEPADAWWIALDNIVVDNNPPPQGKDVILVERFDNGIPATWKNQAGAGNPWGTEPLKGPDGNFLRNAGGTPLNLDYLREVEAQRATGLNLPADAVSRYTVKDMQDFTDLQTVHPNAFIDGRFMMMLAGGKYAMWEEGQDTTEVATLDTPALDLSRASAVFLDFDSEWLHGNASTFFEVHVSTDGGANFSRILTYQEALSDRTEATYFMHHYLEVPVAAGKSQVVFRFRAAGGDPGQYEGFWVIDNVRVTANLAAAAEPPVITAHPQTRTVTAGATVSFAVTATGTAPLSYQWRKGTSNLSDGGNVAGATTATLTLSNVQAGDAGNYSVVVSNAAGSATSNPATLTVNPAGAAPGKPEDNGLLPKTDTFYINTQDTINNARTESLGVAIANNGNVIIGWEDDGADLTDLEAVWTLFNSSGASITPITTITTIDPNFAGQTLDSKFLSFFRSDGSAISGRTSWGPKIKASLFGDGIGMGATAFDLGIEVTELAAIQFNAAGENAGDFPAVQLLDNSGKPVRILSGLDEAYAERDGDVRIGDWEYLSNGNIVIVGESRQRPDLVNIYGGTAEANHAIYRILDRNGAEIKAVSLVSETPDGNAIWHGLGVTQDGFAVRFDQGGAKVRLFDNAGNPRGGNLDLATITGKPAAGGGGRGDGVGFHGNGKDAYVAVSAGNDDQGVLRIWVTVLNADGTVRYSRSASDDVQLTGTERMDAAIAPSGEVIVVYGAKYVDGPTVNTVLGRLLDAAGNPKGRTFYVSEKEVPSPDILESRRPRVAWRSGLAVVVWESQNSPDAPGTRTVAARYFSTVQPGTVESAGLTRIVPDTVVLNQDIDNLANWEPYISVLGNSTFLIEGNAYAEGSQTDMRYVVAFQPVDGKPAKLGEAFFADNGTPYKGSINLSRQNGNPGRVAGDKRPGAVNFIVGGEASPHGFPEFQSDTRWGVNGIYTDVNRYGTVQTFSLDPATLAQTSLSKAFDPVNGQNTAPFTGNAGEVSRFGGEVAALDNGNFVVVIDDRSNMVAPRRTATAAIIKPNGEVVKAGFAIDGEVEAQIWSNVAAYKGGFCARFNGNLYFFDNAGNLQGKVDQATSGEGFDRGRGDGARIAAHINSPYVFLAGEVTAGDVVRVAVWDARDRSFVTVASVSELGFPGGTDRVNLAVDALNRVTVAWETQPAGYPAPQVAARVLAFNGATKSITPLTPSFFAFINTSGKDFAAEGKKNIRSRRMSVAMTTKEICIAAKGEINLQNKPDQGGDSPQELNFYTVFSHPDPKDDPTPPVGLPIEAIVLGRPTVAAGKINLVWAGGRGPFTVQKKANLTDADWVDLLTTSDRTASVNLEGGQGFLRVVDRVNFTVTLNGAGENPDVETAGTGTGTLILDGNKLTVNVTYGGLTGTVSAAHIHGPATPDQNAGVLKGLVPGLGATGAASGTIQGETTVNSATANHLINGATYFNIHTTFAGGGEIRGQIVPQP